MPNSNRARRAAAALAILAGLLAGPSRRASAAPVEDVVARVNGKALWLSEYRKNLDAVLEQYRRGLPEALKDEDAMRQIREKVLDQMVDDELLAQQAEKQGLKVLPRELDNGILEIKERFKADEEGKPVDPEKAEAAFQAELKREGLDLEGFKKRIKRQLMVRKLIEESVRPKAAPPKESEVRAYFEKMQAFVKGDTSTVKGLPPMEAQQFQLFAGRLKDASAERVRARHVLIRAAKDAPLVERSKALNRIKDLQKQLKGGADFAQLARKHSEDAESAKRGGDLGFFLRGWMVPEFEKAAFALGVGDVSDVVETQFGYHLIKVEEKRASQAVDFEDVEEQLTQALTAMRVQGELEKMVGELRAKATIERHLPGEGEPKSN